MNKRYFKPIIAALLLLVAQGRVTAQEVSEFTFSHIGQTDGMHSQRIYSVLQTNDGALWWSGKNDIERYNGVNIKHYPLGEPGKYSDAAGKIIKIYNHYDKGIKSPESSTLLAFDNKGRIFSYDVVHDKYLLRADIGSLMKEQIDLNDMLMTGKGFWLATNKGIFFLHEQTLIPVARKYHANYIIPTGKSLLFCTRQGVLNTKERKMFLRQTVPCRT